MKNGNGRRRNVVRWVVAVTGMLALVALMFPPQPATAIVPDTPCREDCQRSKDERDAICGGLPTEEARKTCLASSAKLYEPCQRECVRKNDDLRECLDECEYRKGREDEACARKRDPIKRKQCFSEAMRKYVECKRECEKKHKPKE